MLKFETFELVRGAFSRFSTDFSAEITARAFEVIDAISSPARSLLRIGDQSQIFSV